MSLPSEGYSLIPQSEDATLADFGLGIDAAPNNLQVPTPTGGPPLTCRIETQIRWIHFVLGCSVLLPWNGIIWTTTY